MYREKFRNADFAPVAFRDLRDLGRIPFTTKADLRSYSFADRLAVPEERLVRYFSSSGSTGKPVVFGFTKRDMRVGSVCCSKTFSCATFTKEDRVLEIVPGGLQSAAVAQAGLERIGAKIIHTLPGRTADLQIPILLGRFDESMKPTAMIALANYMVRIAEVARQRGVDPRDFRLRKMFTGGEVWSESKRRMLQGIYGAPLFDAYGLTEVVGGPGVGAECTEHAGLHVWEDHFVVEVVDPQSGETLGPGKRGEVVLTTLESHAHPMIRYRTGDITDWLSYDRCSCGRLEARIGRIVGRADDRVKVRGVQIYPREVEEVLLGIPGAGPEYKVVVRERDGVDVMLITVESNERHSTDPRSLAGTISQKFKGVFNVTPTVEVLQSGTMEVLEGAKTRRFLDERNR